jgi:hypothetical protein
MAKLGIKLLFSSSSHPQMDGQMEVLNRSLGTLLCVLINKNLKAWKDCIAQAEFAYNRAEHSTTKQSPFEVVYGFDPPTAVDLLLLPLHESVNMDIAKRADYMKIHGRQLGNKYFYIPPTSTRRNTSYLPRRPSVDSSTKGTDST